MNPETEAALRAAFEAAHAASTTAESAAAVLNATVDTLTSSKGQNTGQIIRSAQSSIIAALGGIRDDDGTFMSYAGTGLATNTAIGMVEGKGFWKALYGALPLSPLLRGIFGLFGGGEEEPPPLVKYTLPDALNVEAGLYEDGGLGWADYDQVGGVRVFSKQTASASGAGPGTAPGPASRDQMPIDSMNLTSMNLTVNALDARSIVDRAPEIASAVRIAMLNGSQINDTIVDL